MTCEEAAELIYRFAETKPSSPAQKEFQEHVQKCARCTEFLRKIAKQIDRPFDISCGEIPTELFEKFSVLVQKNPDLLRK